MEFLLLAGIASLVLGKGGSSPITGPSTATQDIGPRGMDFGWSGPRAMGDVAFAGVFDEGQMFGDDELQSVFGHTGLGARFEADVQKGYDWSSGIYANRLVA